MATIRYTLRQFVFKTPETVRHCLYSDGPSGIVPDNPPNWFGRHSAPLGSGQLIESSGDWGTNTGPAFDEPFLRVDLVTGEFAVRPPQTHHVRTIKDLTLRTRNNVAQIVPGWTHLPGVERIELSGGGVILEDNAIRNRRGENISWLHLTALQSAGRDWGNDQRLWRSAPRLDWLVRGARVRYPQGTEGNVSLTPSKWSSNPAAIRAWLLTNRRQVPITSIDTASLSRAINICDQTYTVFMGDPEGLREDINPHDEDDGEWFYDSSLSKTVNLPGATANTKITAVAQDPLFPQRIVLVSSSDRKFWVSEVGRFIAYDFPTVATRDALPGQQIYPAGGASFMHDGTLVVGMRANAEEGESDERTLNPASKDGYDYPSANRWHIYMRRLRLTPGHILDADGVTARNRDGTIATSGGADELPNRDVGLNIGDEYMSRAATSTRWDSFFATTAVRVNPSNDSATDLFGWWTASGGSGHDYWFTISSNNSVSRRGWIPGNRLITDSPYATQYINSSLYSYWMFSDGHVEAFAPLTPWVPVTEPGGNLRYEPLNYFASLNAPADVWPSDFRGSLYRWGGFYFADNQRHLEFVRRDTDASGNVMVDVLRRTKRLLDFAYRTAVADTPTAQAEDGRNRLTAVWWERTPSEGGAVALGFLRPRGWDDVNATQLTAPQARVWRGSVYVAREDLPANYWDAPPESPLHDAVVYEMTADGQTARDDEGNRVRAPDSGNWEREPGTRHVFAPNNLSNAEVRQLRLFSKRYEAHGEVASGEALLEVERQLDRAMLGHTVLAGGKYFFTAGRNELWTERGVDPASPVTSITDEDLVGDTGILSARVTPPREEIATQVTCELLQDETEEWTPQAIVVTDVWAALRHGETLPVSVPMDHVTAPMQAKSIANALLMEERQSLQLEIEVRPRLSAAAAVATDGDPAYSLASLLPGDVVSCELSSLNLNRNMIVESTSLDLDTTIVKLVLKPHVVGHTSHFFTAPPITPSPEIRSYAELGLDPPGGTIAAAGMSLDRRFIFVGTNTGRSATRLRPGADGFVINPHIKVYDTATRKTGVLEDTTYWNGSTESGLALGGGGGDPDFTSATVYGDREATNSVAFPTLAPEDDPTGVVFNSTGDDVVATAWFHDVDPPNERTLRNWEFNPGIQYKVGRDTGRLGPDHHDGGAIWMGIVGWDARPGQNRMVYAGELIGPGNTSSLSDTANIATDASSPWGGTVLFDGDYPVRTDYTAILDDGTYSYWLRADMGVEIRGTIYLWDRQAPILRHSDLDLPAGRLRAGSSIAIRSVEPDAIITLYEFLADGSGIRRWDNRNDRTGEAGSWQLRRGPLE